LFRLTGDARWHTLFLTTTAFKEERMYLYEWRHHSQADAAFVYLRTDRPGVDAETRRKCLAAILRTADLCAGLSAKSGFGYTRDTPWQPFMNLMGAPRGAVNILRAHALTGKAEYLAAAVLACQSGAGANPSNLCYTTGVGRRSPEHPLVVDQRVTAQPPPPGITVYGPVDVTKARDNFAVKLIAPHTSPPPWEWPVTESWFDVYMHPIVCEYTVHESLGPNAYVWGYLAARE
ncbi:MAG: glycoside hydrolase family 9 protein, partial [Planctomycetes bacterium]|nr:glycoside hydrolase family 9 protein [Planctomycetota bacterium]